MSLDTCVYTAHIMLYTLVTRIAYHYAVEEYSSRDCTIQIRTPVTKLMCNNIKYFHETDHHGCDRMVVLVGFITTYRISTYHH
jgi:hypothetical protein